jgi:hypothetical protein
MAADEARLLRQWQALAVRWRSALTDWFTARVRPEAYRQWLLQDTEGPVQLLTQKGTSMSRYALPAHDPALTVAVGWDPPLQTFFGQVIRPSASAGADDAIVAWVGTRSQDIPTVGQLAEHLAPYADITVGTQARLTQDQLASLPPTALQATPGVPDGAARPAPGPPAGAGDGILGF